MISFQTPRSHLIVETGQLSFVSATFFLYLLVADFKSQTSHALRKKLEEIGATK